MGGGWEDDGAGKTTALGRRRRRAAGLGCDEDDGGQTRTTHGGAGLRRGRRWAELRRASAEATASFSALPRGSLPLPLFSPSLLKFGPFDPPKIRATTLFSSWNPHVRLESKTRNSLKTKLEILKMNQLVARAVLRGLIGGRSCKRYVSPPSAAAAAVVRPFDEAVVMWRAQCLGQWRKAMSTAAEKTTAVAEKDEKESTVAAATEKKKEGGEVMVASYWGISRPKITREDGTEWPWNCFMPWETYQSDLTIDLSKHHVPKTFLDKVAYRTVKILRIPTDIFFQRRYGCRAMMLETVAAVPGMVGGMLLHLRSLRKFEHSGGWVKALLEEAENERMHLMTMVELVKPKWYERLLVLTVQGVFFNAFFVLYLLSPKLAHRVVGYLEEEAIHSYTEYLKDIGSGKIENIAAPAIAIDYWRLPKDSTLKDVITVIRADEAHHRDVNHFASDVHYQGKELREAPAPIGYR